MTSKLFLIAVLSAFILPLNAQRTVVTDRIKMEGGTIDSLGKSPDLLQTASDGFILTARAIRDFVVFTQNATLQAVADTAQAVRSDIVPELLEYNTVPIAGTNTVTLD
ncbi:MAG: hypothetical protein AAFY91_16725, partial [Bacteroidota bacterium]